MKRFDDRQTCFYTGKKLSPPMSERKLCACCGLRIVKGFVLEIGHVGEDCANLIQRRENDKVCYGRSVEEFAALWRQHTGLEIKPSVLRTLHNHYS